jgi:two-component system, OmpR family, sensor kinase
LNALPLRLRLTLAFAVAMATLLAAMGLFVYVRVGDALVSSVDQGLRSQAAEAASHTRERSLIDPDVAGGPSVAQLLDKGGHLLRSTPPGLPPLVDRAAVARVVAGARVLRTRDLPGRRKDWRVLTLPVQADGRTRVLVVARSLESRHESLQRLSREFVIAGPIALLLASLAGYGLAAAALRPVESMRRRAQAISAATPGRRLPVPTARDEIQRLAETLNDMLDRLEGAFEHERRFVAHASHELRTPLALLRTELEVALRRPRSHEELQAALASAAEDTERLTRLAEDLLLIARSDQGGLPVRREQVDTAELLRTIADRFAARAKEQGRTIEVSPNGDLAVDADPARLEQALGNLIDNALRHGAGRIELTARPRGRLVELHVLDAGPGFPPAFVEHAFDRFSRADGVRGGDGRGGSGLGLSIADLIARAHGGEAGAATRTGGGADVWIAVERADGAFSDVS